MFFFHLAKKMDGLDTGIILTTPIRFDLVHESRQRGPFHLEQGTQAVTGGWICVFVYRVWDKDSHVFAASLFGTHLPFQDVNGGRC
jgi:hypothetical protein